MTNKKPQPGTRIYAALLALRNGALGFEQWRQSQPNFRRCDFENIYLPQLLAGGYIAPIGDLLAMTGNGWQLIYDCSSAPPAAIPASAPSSCRRGSVPAWRDPRQHYWNRRGAGQYARFASLELGVLRPFHSALPREGGE